jgi:hypothetical protein
MTHRKYPLEPERGTCTYRQEKGGICEHADCRQCQLGLHCGRHSLGCHQDCGPQRGYAPDSNTSLRGGAGGTPLPPEEMRYDG